MSKSIKIFLLFLLTVYITFAQNVTDKNGKKQGPWKKKDDAGKLLYEGTFVDDKPVGEFKHYHETGELKAKMNYTKGTTAYVTLYYTNGKKMGQGKYVDQKRDSLWKFFDVNELLISEENYIVGKKNGVHKNYFKTGQVAEVKNWKNDVEEGEWKQYYDDGIIKSEGIYKNGFLEGVVKFYYPDGKPSAKGKYQHAVKDGIWEYYNTKGVIQSRDTFNLGKLKNEKPQITNKEWEEIKNSQKED